MQSTHEGRLSCAPSGDLLPGEAAELAVLTRLDDVARPHGELVREAAELLGDHVAEADYRPPALARLAAGGLLEETGGGHWRLREPGRGRRRSLAMRAAETPPIGAHGRVSLVLALEAHACGARGDRVALAARIEHALGRAVADLEERRRNASAARALVLSGDLAALGEIAAQLRGHGCDAAA